MVYTEMAVETYMVAVETYMNNLPQTGISTFNSESKLVFKKLYSFIITCNFVHRFRDISVLHFW